MTPLRLSWSQLRAHFECRQKAYLLRSHHRSPAANIRSYFHGMVVDRVMRDWLADPDHPTGAMAGMVDDAITRTARQATTDGDGVVRWKSATDRTELRAFCTELVTRLEPILRTHVLPYPYESAVRFTAPVRIPGPDGTPTTITLVGEMDLLVAEAPHQWAVWDLKGTKDDTYWRKVLGQLVFYDLAVLASRGAATTRAGLIQPMCRRPVLEFTIADEHRRQMWAAICRAADEIWANDTACKPDTDGCGYCEVRHACPRYGDPTSLAGALHHAARTGQP